MRSLAKRLALGSVLAAVYPSYLLATGALGGNIHEVVPGQLYRSAQINGPLLGRTLDTYRIASVLNLRGGHSGVGFYDEEVSACWRRGIVHADVPMSATRLPRPVEIARLLAAFDRLPRPLLVHCRAGADRTGLAVALYGVVYQGMALDSAQSRGLTWRCGHTGRGRAAAMDRFFDLYRTTSHGEGLRSWIGLTYPAVYQACGGRA